jgi:hypothetical protein
VGVLLKQHVPLRHQQQLPPQQGQSQVLVRGRGRGLKLVLAEGKGVGVEFASIRALEVLVRVVGEMVYWLRVQLVWGQVVHLPVLHLLL